MQYGSDMDRASRLRRARTFDEIAPLYDRARRGYREALFDDLFRLAGIEAAKARILEIGCGTGQATVSLAARGASIVCIELGENLARLAAQNLARSPRVAVVHADFEQWEPEDGKLFDIVFAATSWHWIDPALRYAKAARLLKPGGVLAFTTGAHAFPPDVDPFFLEVQAAYRAVGMEWQGAWPPPPPETVPDSTAEIAASGLFEDIKVARHLGTQEYDADSHVALMQTASDHRLLEEEKREFLFSEMRRLIAARPGGRITKHELTILHVARKR